MTIGELRTGTENIKKTAEGNKVKGRRTPFISWKADETKSVYFLTPIDEVPKVLMHNFVRKYEEVEGERKEYWLTFMCRKDPAWVSESGGRCPLCDDIYHQPQEKFVALAVEVEPIMDGKKVKGVEVKYNKGKDKDGNEVDYPQIGLVIQGAKNFFNTLVAQDQRREIADISWDITREGSGLETSYFFYPIEYKPDLDSIKEFTPEILDVLDNLGSKERYDKEMPGIKAEDQPSFGGNKTKRGDSKDEAFEILKKNLENQKLESY